MMDLLESMHATQSTSAKALICKEDLDGKNNPCHGVPLRLFRLRH